jgi:hypothetical protein
MVTPRVPRKRPGCPKIGGNCVSSERVCVRPPAAKMFELIEDAVASSAAIAMIVKPASPSAGRAASAKAVSPCSITSSTVSVPKTPRLTAT